MYGKRSEVPRRDDLQPQTRLRCVCGLAIGYKEVDFAAVSVKKRGTTRFFLRADYIPAEYA